MAIVGSGPSGLTAAGDLVQKGHQVHVFEALHEVGGVLVYGIPEFRLPKQIIRVQREECLTWEKEELPVECDEVDVANFHERRLATFGVPDRN